MWVWKVVLFQNINLRKVALLYKENRLHFAILRRSSNSVALEGGKQVDEGIYFATPDSDVGHVCYTVVVRFCGGLFGSFFQSVIFDFGRPPVIVRKLNVEVGSASTQEKIRSLRSILECDR